MPKVKLNLSKVEKNPGRSNNNGEESQLYKMTIKGKTVNVKRARRVLLTDDQTSALERAFQRLRKDYDPTSNDPAKRWLIIPASTIDRLSKKIGLTRKKVRNGLPTDSNVKRNGNEKMLTLLTHLMRCPLPLACVYSLGFLPCL